MEVEKQILNKIRNLDILKTKKDVKKNSSINIT